MKVLKGVGLDARLERVLVSAGCVVSVIAACVDIAAKVCAADVYKALRVAAGWGVPGAKRPQARMDASTRTRSISFLKREVIISASVGYSSISLNVSSARAVPNK